MSKKFIKTYKFLDQKGINGLHNLLSKEITERFKVKCSNYIFRKTIEDHLVERNDFRSVKMLMQFCKKIS